jgi:hypothetical protein
MGGTSRGVIPSNSINGGGEEREGPWTTTNSHIYCMKTVFLNNTFWEEFTKNIFFSTPSRLTPGPTQPRIQWTQGFLTGGKGVDA